MLGNNDIFILLVKYTGLNPSDSSWLWILRSTDPSSQRVVEKSYLKEQYLIQLPLFNIVDYLKLIISLLRHNAPQSMRLILLLLKDTLTKKLSSGTKILSNMSLWYFIPKVNWKRCKMKKLKLRIIVLFYFIFLKSWRFPIKMAKGK